MVEHGKILIIEDEEELAELLEYNLRQQGFVTLSANDGLTGCRLAGAEKPDLILLDLLLPDLDGWEICKLIRGHPDERMATTPIVMLTALSSPNDRLKGLELGADAYLPKPFALKEVFIQARRLIEKHRREAGLAGEIALLRRRAALQADLQSMLFHELRNQILVISGFSTLLGNNLQDSAQEKPAGYAEAIRRSSAYLGDLAEEFLLAEKFEAGVLQLPGEVLHLGRLLEETAGLYRPVADGKAISLALEEEPTTPPVWANPAAARMVVSTLLDNALKYSPEKTPVQIGLHRHSDTCLAVRVSDRGRGIPAEVGERIFDKFYRGPDSARNAPGSGLGLYLAKILTEAMNGSLEMQSRPGAGTCFTLRLPVWQAGTKEEQQMKPLEPLETR